MQTKTYKHILTMKLDDGREFHLPYQITADGEVWFAEALESDGRVTTARIGNTEITDTIEEQGELMCITRRWNLRGNFTARVSFSALMGMEGERWYVPGVIYESVDGGGSEEWPSVPESICPIPSMCIVEGNGKCLAAFTQSAGSTDDISSVSAQVSDDHAQVTITVPGEKSSGGGPLSSLLPGAGVRDWKIDGRITYERVFYLYVGPGGDALEKLVNIAWNKFMFQPAEDFDAGEILRAGAGRLLGRFFVERNDAVGFVEETDRAGFAVRPRLRGGGSGGNVEAARALYRVGRMTDDRDMRRVALDTADFFLTGGTKDQSLRLDYHPVRRRWLKPGRLGGSLRATGEMLSAAARMNRTAGDLDANPRWLFTARKIADMLFDEWRKSLANNDEDEKPGKGGAEGEKFRPEGPEAPFLAVGFLELFRETGDQRYLQAGAWLVEKAEPRLVGSLMPQPGGEPILSRDSAHAMLSASLILHAETGDGKYLETAVSAAKYIRTLTYIYQAALPEKSVLGSMGFDTRGAVPPVPGSYHLDPGSAVIAPDLLALWKATGDELWNTLARMILGFSLGLAAGRGPFLRGEYHHGIAEDEPGAWGAATGEVSGAISAVMGAVLDVAEEFPEVLVLGSELPPVDNWKPAGLSRLLLYIGSYLNLFA